MYNAGKYPGKGEYNTGVSLTVPDETLSIRELVRNHTRGLPSNVVAKTPVYLGDEETYPFYDHLDEIDKHDLLHAAKQEINAIQSEFAEKQKQKQKQQNTEDKKQQPPKSLENDKEPPPAPGDSTKAQSGA